MEKKKREVFLCWIVERTQSLRANSLEELTAQDRVQQESESTGEHWGPGSLMAQLLGAFLSCSGHISSPHYELLKRVRKKSLGKNIQKVSFMPNWSCMLQPGIGWQSAHASTGKQAGP